MQDRELKSVLWGDHSYTLSTLLMSPDSPALAVGERAELSFCSGSKSQFALGLVLAWRCQCMASFAHGAILISAGVTLRHSLHSCGRATWVHRWAQLPTSWALWCISLLLQARRPAPVLCDLHDGALRLGPGQSAKLNTAAVLLV